MPAKLLMSPKGETLLYLRLCVDISPICNQYFDYFCLSSKGCYVQCCVSFLKQEIFEKSTKPELEHRTMLSRTYSTLKYSTSCDKIQSTSNG